MPRKQGGLGEMKMPLLADKSMEISRAYGVLKEDAGLTFRWVSAKVAQRLINLFLISPSLLEYIGYKIS